MSQTGLIAKLKIRDDLQVDVDFDKKQVDIRVSADADVVENEYENPDALKLALAWAAGRLLEAGAEMSADYNDKPKSECMMTALQDLILMIQPHACRSDEVDAPDWWTATRGRAAAHE